MERRSDSVTRTIVDLMKRYIIKRGDIVNAKMHLYAAGLTSKTVERICNGERHSG